MSNCQFNQIGYYLKNRSIKIFYINDFFLKYTQNVWFTKQKSFNKLESFFYFVTAW